MGDASKVTDGFGHDGIPPFGSSVLVKQVVDKATEPGITSSSAAMVLAGFLTPFINAALAKLGFGISEGQVLAFEGLAIAFVLQRGWAKAGLHKLASVLLSVGLPAASKEVDDLAS